MTTLRVVTLLLVLAAVTAVAWRLWRPPPSTPGKGTAPAAAAVRVELPAGWQQIAEGDDYASWASNSRQHTVTLGRSRAARTPLALVVAGSHPGLRRSLPGLRDLELRSLPDGAVASAFKLVDGHDTVHVRQVWARSPDGRIDTIATWTSSDGSWPLALRRMAPQFGAE